jgi:hypothetical protein
MYYYYFYTATMVNTELQPQLRTCITYYFYTATMVNTGLQPHIQNIYYLLLLHGNNGDANAPQCDVYTYTACVVYFYFTVVFFCHLE